MQPDLAVGPSPETVGTQHLIQIRQKRLSDSECLDRISDLGILPRIPALGLGPLEEDLGNARIWHPIVTLAAHQEQVRDVVAASKRASYDVATSKGNAIPAAEDFTPTRVGSFYVVLGAVVEAAGPTTWLAPINPSHHFNDAILPELEYFGP